MKLSIAFALITFCLLAMIFLPLYALIGDREVVCTRVSRGIYTCETVAAR
jgi:hypothetical protein